MLENIHSSSLLRIMRSGPFLFPDADALGKMQMASIYNLEPADNGEKQSYCTYVLAPPKKYNQS